MTLEQTLRPHPSLSDQAFEAITDALVSGEIQPGSRIKEAVIARNLGISRGTLREAIRRLETHGLIERHQNLGTSVVQLTESDLDDLFQFREVLEGRAAGLAARYVTDADIEELQAMMDRHSASTIRTGSYKQLTSDDDFHIFITRKSGSPRLYRALGTELYLQIRLYRFRSASRPGRSEMALAEHRDILAALAERNEARAEEAMRAHVANARKNLLWQSDSPETTTKGTSR